MKTVSILMSTHNGGAHITAQLDSIRRQSLQPSELWVSDDGSSDETLKIVTRFAETARFPVRICVNGEGSDPRSNLLNAALLCGGDVVAFCGQGDEWHPNKLSRCVAAFQTSDVMLVAHSATVLDEQSRYAGYLSQGIQCTQIHPALTLPPWGSFLTGSMVFRRDLLALPPAREPADGPKKVGPVMRPDRWLYTLAHGLGSVVTLAQPLMATRQPPARPAGLLQHFFRRGTGLSSCAAARRLRHLEATALQRAQVMRALAQSRPHWLKARVVLAAATYWQRMAMLCALRAAVYDAPTFSRRKAAFDRLVALRRQRLGGDARAGGWLVRDALTGLLQLPAFVPGHPAAEHPPGELGQDLEAWAWPR
jgi:glycosyltransferase involved in cell wall biosynthesis